MPGWQARVYVRRLRVVHFVAQKWGGGKEENPKPRQLLLLGHQRISPGSAPLRHRLSF